MSDVDFAVETVKSVEPAPSFEVAMEREQTTEAAINQAKNVGQSVAIVIDDAAVKIMEAEARAEVAIAAASAKEAEYDVKLQRISEGAVHVMQQQADLAALIEEHAERERTIHAAIAAFVKAIT